MDLLVTMEGALRRAAAAVELIILRSNVVGVRVDFEKVRAKKQKQGDRAAAGSKTAFAVPSSFYPT